MAIKTDGNTRYREIGRIRIGEKGKKGNPVALETFRMTSPNKHLLDVAAQHYGGSVKKWENPPTQGEQWELITEAKELPVLIPHQDVVESLFFELWSGGGCKRRCDGVTELMSGEPCLCEQSGNKDCKLSTHVLFLLPSLPDIGVWRLSSTGINAGQELPSAISLLLQMSKGHLPEAILAIERRTSKSEGTTKHFSVPVIRTEKCLNDLLADSQSQYGTDAISPTDQVALPQEGAASPSKPTGNEKPFVATKQMCVKRMTDMGWSGDAKSEVVDFLFFTAGKESLNDMGRTEIEQVWDTLNSGKSKDELMEAVNAERAEAAAAG